MLYWFYAAIFMHILAAGAAIATFLTGKKLYGYISMVWGLSALALLYYFLWQFFTGTVNGFGNVGNALDDIWNVMFQMMQKIGRT